MLHLVGHTLEYTYDAQTPERQRCGILPYRILDKTRECLWCLSAGAVVQTVLKCVGAAHFEKCGHYFSTEFKLKAFL